MFLLVDKLVSTRVNIGVSAGLNVVASAGINVGAYVDERVVGLARERYCVSAGVSASIFAR